MDTTTESRAQSAAMPSPFPAHRRLRVPLQLPHRRAGGAGWRDRLALPAQLRLTEPVRPLLDRQAGYFRLGPFGINHPTARVYEPGTNILATTWKTPTGWLLVRDALTMGPREHEDRVTPHTRPLSRGVRLGTRVTAVLALASLVLAWGMAQRPYLLPTSLTVADGAGDPDTLRWLLIVTAVAVVVVAHALALLYRLDLSDRLLADHDADLIEDPSLRDGGTGAGRVAPR